MMDDQAVTLTADIAKAQGDVNTAKTEWTHVRVPRRLAERLDRLSSQALKAHAAGRITLPGSMVGHVPVWYVIERALDEQEARRARSNRSRPRR